MGKKVEVKERVVQRSIGFRFRQIEFFDKYPEFKPDEFCRKAIDDQISQVDPDFLEKDNDSRSEESRN